MRSFLAMAMAGALALSFAGGCVGPKEFQLDASKNGSSLNAEVGDSITLELEGNPTTGFLWVFAAPYDEEILIMTGESYSKPDEGKDGAKRMGAPTTKTMTFKAVGPGRTGLKLEYRRPWEKGIAPAKVFECLVSVTGEAPKDGLKKEEETPRRGSNGQIAKPRNQL